MKRSTFILFGIFFLTSCQEEVKLDKSSLSLPATCHQVFAGEALQTVAPIHVAEKRIYFNEDCRLKGYDLTTLKEVRQKWAACVKGDSSLLKDLGSLTLDGVLEKGFNAQAKLFPDKKVTKEKYYEVYFSAIMRMKNKSTVGQFCRSSIAVLNTWKKKKKDQLF